MYSIWEMETIENEKKIKAKIIFENTMNLLKKDFLNLKESYCYTDHSLMERILEDIFLAFHYSEKEIHYILPQTQEIEDFKRRSWKDDIKEVVWILKEKWWSIRRIAYAMGISHEKVRNM